MVILRTARAALCAGALIPVCSSAAPTALQPIVAAAACSALPTPVAGLKPFSPPASLAPLTAQVAAGGHADFILSAAPGTTALTSLSYTYQIEGQTTQTIVPKVPITTQQATQDQIKQAGLTENGNAIVLTVEVPATNGLDPLALSEDKKVSVFGCAQTGQTPYGIYASRIVKITEPNVARFWAAFLIAGLYLCAATCVWAKRRSAVRSANNSTALPPVRIAPVHPWSWWRCLDPVVMTSDVYDRGSLSQLQILFFAGIIVFGMTELALTTGSLSTLSPAIVYLLGIPAAGTFSAQLAGVSRERLSADNWAWLVGRGVLPANTPGSRVPRWRDLIMQDDAELDLSKLQALGFSIVVGIALVQAGFSGLGSFTIPNELLQILGLSQLVFVGGRFTKPATMGDIDQLVTTLRSRYLILVKTAKAGADLNPDGTFNAATGAAVKTYTAAQGSLPNAVAQYAEIANEVAILLDGLTHRGVDTTPLTAPTNLS